MLVEALKTENLCSYKQTLNLGTVYVNKHRALPYIHQPCPWELAVGAIGDGIKLKGHEGDLVPSSETGTVCLSTASATLPSTRN